MIEVNNLTTIRIDEEFLKKIASKVLKNEKQKTKDLSIALVGRKRIRELNKKYRKKNRATDVLSFSDEQIGLGEIVICIREIKKNAKKFNCALKEELARVLIHGILHLLGHEHEKSLTEAEKMEEKQNYYTKLCQKLIL